MVACCLLTVVCCVLRVYCGSVVLVVRCLLVFVRGVCCLLNVVGYSLFVAPCYVLVVRCSLRVASSRSSCVVAG